MRSLAKDKNDERGAIGIEPDAWRAENGLSIGFTVPFFFTRQTASLPLVGAFKGAAALLIAGGPSLGSVDLGKITALWRMTLNNGPASMRPNANCTVDEPGRFNLSTWLDPTIMKFVPMGQFEKPLWDNRYADHRRSTGSRNGSRSKLRDGRLPQRHRLSAQREVSCPSLPLRGNGQLGQPCQVWRRAERDARGDAHPFSARISAGSISSASISR